MTDTPEDAATWKKIVYRYRPDAMDHFAKAFAELLLSTDNYEDTLGDVYMEWGHPNKYAGQFFTPSHVAQLMAQMTMGDMEEQLKARVLAGIEKSIPATAALFAGMNFQGRRCKRWYYETVLPLALPYIDPITVCDPCCGSGVMFLAAAQASPRWAIDFGLIQFYGMDIDQTCVTMAQINCMIYGLNGFGLKCAVNAPQAEIDRLPQPYVEIYTEARTATPERVGELIAEVKATQSSYWSQPSLMEIE